MQSIKKNSRFRQIYAEGKSRADRYLVMYRSRSRDGEAHLGITVSGKIGHAAVRNRIRRRIREIIRLNGGRIIDGYDIIFVARKPAPDADYRTLEKSVLKLMGECGLLKEGSSDE